MVFSGGGGPVLCCSAKAEKYMASTGQLLFLYVLECPVYPADRLFHNCDLWMRTTSGTGVGRNG